MIILIKLVAAHLIGDFMLQSDKLCRQKQSKSITKRLWVIAVHSFVQAILSYLFVGLWNCILLPLFVFITHYVIDLIKVQTGRNGLVTFIIDQLAHYVALCIIWWVMFVNSGSICGYASTCLLPISIWIVVTSYIALLAPTSILIKKFLEYNKWLPENPMQGLPNAGKWIGYLERVLILTFILTDNVEGVGFLLAAKSVFRFGELSRVKDLKFTEYVLIGTFASFAVAILIGFATRWFISFSF